MVLLIHELRQGRTALIIWTAVIAGMMGICVMIYPEMAQQMGTVSDLFSEMGSFSAAFGMDRINFGEFLGFFGVECGNILGLGGAFFAALLGIGALAREERDQTAEFLLSHPVSRSRIVFEKFLGILAQLILLNLCVVGVTAISVTAIGETPDVKTLALLLLSYFLLQLEVASICFGISAFLCRSGMGLGLGIATLLYFLNLIANLTQGAAFLKYLTPFGYTEGADIIANGGISLDYLAVGMGLGLVGLGVAFYWYTRKDIG